MYGGVRGIVGDVAVVVMCGLGREAWRNEGGVLHAATDFLGAPSVED